MRSAVTAPTPAAGRAFPRRRLIFLNRYFYPDVSATAQMLTDLTRTLEQEDYDLHVICSRQLYDRAEAGLPAQGRVGRTIVHRVWSARFGRNGLLGRAFDYLSYSLCAVGKLLWLARPDDCIVAMTDPPFMSVCAAAVARVRRARLINWLQDVFPEVATALGVLRLPRRLNDTLTAVRNWSLRVADKNVVLGAGMHRRISALQISPEKQQIIENWADSASITPLSADCSNLRRSLAVNGRFLIQYSGNMGRAHEYETLLGAARELRDENDWLFLFVGGGANMERLRAKAEASALRNTRFLPYQPREKLRDSLAAADVHVLCLLPALEGLIVPSKLYGILAAGRPVIVIGDPDGEQAEVVRAAGCGCVIRSGDSAALVRALRHMRSDPAWVRRAALQAYELFERRYTLTIAAQKWRALVRTPPLEVLD